MKWMVAVFFAVFSMVAVAPFSRGQDPSRPDLENLSQSGKLFIIRLQPGDKNLKIYLAGKEEAEIDWEKAELEVELIQSQENRKLLRVIQKKDYFAVEDALDTTKPTRLEIKAKHKGKSETFKFNLHNRP